MSKVICPHNCPDCYAMRVCSLKAIQADNGSVLVDRKVCIGCGACRTACMTFGYKVLEKRTGQWMMGAA